MTFGLMPQHTKDEGSMPRRLPEFLAYYERAHRNVANRYVHHLAHSLAGLSILWLWRPVLGVSLIAAGFGLSWAGHYALERNTPAFFDPATQRGFRAGFCQK